MKKEDSNKKNNNKDSSKNNSKLFYTILIVIIIILIIIIILLLRNYKNLRISKPTGNVEYFEVDCNCNNSGLQVSDELLTWRSINKLNIFKNPVYKMEEVIAPGSSNSYQFVIKNNSDCNLTYSLSFLENNKFDINMKYRLKKNDKYLIKEWVGSEKLLGEEEVLKSSKEDNYLLEWKWFDDSNDTSIGAIEGSNYSLSIEIVGTKDME